MKKIVRLLIVPVAALLGAGGGYALRMNAVGAVPGAHSGEAETREAAGSGAVEGVAPKAEQSREKPHETKENGKNAGSGHQKPGEPSTYMKFSRQFVAPIVKSGRPAAMMILDINLELDPAAADSIYPEEPKLRDAILKVLLEQASEGKLDGVFRDRALLEETRAKLLDSVRAVVGDDVISVLIMDLGYQEL